MEVHAAATQHTVDEVARAVLDGEMRFGDFA